MVLFLDIDSAFSSASIGGMVNCLINQGVNPWIIKWFKYMLENRVATATAFGEIMKKVTDRGAPQGGIGSGVLLWNPVMNDLHRRFPKVHASKLTGFADDGADAARGKYLNDVIESIQLDITIFEKWAKDHSLKFSPAKCKAMLFTNKTKFQKGRIL